jgi:hypothetical protein
MSLLMLLLQVELELPDPQQIGAADIHLFLLAQ